jgi:hypothetical protein
MWKYNLVYDGYTNGLGFYAPFRSKYNLKEWAASEHNQLPTKSCTTCSTLVLGIL